MLKEMEMKIAIRGLTLALSLLLSIAASAQCYSSCQLTGDSMCPGGVGCIPRMCGDNDNQCAYCQDDGSRQCLQAVAQLTFRLVMAAQAEGVV